MEGKGLESRTAFLLLFPSCSLCPWRSDSPRLQRYRTHGLIPPEFNASPADKLRLAQHQWQGGQCRRPPTTVARRHALLTPWSWDSSPPLMGVPVGSPEGIPPWQSSLPPWARDSFSHLDPPMALAGESAVLSSGTAGGSGAPISPKKMDQNSIWRDLPDGPLAKAPHFHCRGHGFEAWLEELRSLMPKIKWKQNGTWRLHFSCY